MLTKVFNTKKIIGGLTSLKVGYKREWKAILATVFSMFNKVISLAAVLFYVRWTLPYLGEERFGVWMTMSSIITFISIFSDFGLGSSLVNHVASSFSRNELSRLRSYISSAFCFLVITAFLFALVAYYFSGSIITVITNGIQNSNEVLEVKHSLYALFFFFLISLPFITIDKTLEGLQLTYISSIWATAGNLLSLLITFIFTHQSLGIVWLIVGTLGVQSLFRILYFFVEFRGRFRPYSPSLSEATWEKAVTLLKHGLLFFTLNFFNVLAFQVDNIFISKELGVHEVPLFSLMQKLITISLFFWFYTISLWPTFAEAHVKNDKEWIKKTVRFIFRLNLSLGCFFGIIIIFFADSVLSLWSNNLIATPSFAMSLGFALYIILNGLIGIVAIVFNTGPLLKKHIWGFCLASITTVILKLVFIKQLGVDYLIYMSFAPFIIFYLVPCYFKYRKYVQA